MGYLYLFKSCTFIRLNIENKDAHRNRPGTRARTCSSRAGRRAHRSSADRSCDTWQSRGDEWSPCTDQSHSRRTELAPPTRHLPPHSSPAYTLRPRRLSLVTSARRTGNEYCDQVQRLEVTIRLYDTIRDAILTCTRKPTWVSLIYRTGPTTTNCKTEKLKSKNGHAQKYQ